MKHNIPNNWQVKSLGEVLEFHYGKGLSKISREETGAYPVYGSNGVVGYHSNYIVEGPCLVIGRKGSAGEVHYSGKNCWPIDTTYYVNPSHNYSLLFFYYLLKNLRLFNLDKSTAIPGLNRNDAYQIKIPLPPLPIQKQIAEILEKADEAIQKRKEANKLTDEFLQSVFIEMFGDPVKNPKGWEVQELNQIANIERDSVTTNNLLKSDLYIGLEHIEKDSGRLLGYESVENIELKSNKFRFTSDHILYGKLRPYLNKVCLPNINGVCSTDIIPIKPRKNISNKYFLAYLMRMDFFVKEATTKSTGANLPRMSPNLLGKIKLFTPPLSLQQQFAEIVNKTEALKEKQKQSEQELDNLFQSLMQKAFKGELVFVDSQKKISSTDLHAGIIAKIIKAHSDNPKYYNTLGHVKTEKISHIVESHFDLNLGRYPKRIAAGPADFKHLKQVEHRAKMKNWFTVQKREDENGYKYLPGKSFDYLLNDISSELGEMEKVVDEIISKFVHLRTGHSEVIATVYAAWNDLLMAGKNPSDDQIVFEARENWTPEKLKIEKVKFYKCIEWLRRKNLMPVGKGKRTII